jgi:hypothetical protein
MTRPRSTPVGRSSHGLPEFAPRRETQSQLARGRETRDTVMTCPRPASGGRRSHGSLRDHPRAGHAVTARPRPPPRGRHSHGSPRPPSSERHSQSLPEAALGQDTQSRIIQCQPRVGDIFMACLRPPSSERRRHGSAKANLGWENVMTSRPRPPSCGRRSYG